VCDLLTMALERQGASVVACTSARKALEHLATEEFDAVLTDLGYDGDGRHRGLPAQSRGRTPGSRSSS
jgi:CheY-like chemotaxis protein